MLCSAIIYCDDATAYACPLQSSPQSGLSNVECNAAINILTLHSVVRRWYTVYAE